MSASREAARDAETPRPGAPLAAGAAPAADILVGGQAVMEGVMMKVPRAWAVTVRRPDGELVSRSGDLVAWSERWPILKWPLLRGPAILGQMLTVGMSALQFSADVLGEDAKPGVATRIKNTLTLASLALFMTVANGPDGTEADDSAMEAPPAPDAKPKSSWISVVPIVIALAFGILLFKVLPTMLGRLAGAAWEPLKAPWAESLVSGLALMAIFVAYLWLISLLPDMRRVFRYHGAEHQLVHVHEKRLPLTVDSARDQPTEHPRCGTSFLFFVVLTSIVLWMAFPVATTLLGKIALRIALLPLVMGVAFELIRFSARHRTNPISRILMAPGLWSQRITTKTPDDSMREASLRSLELAAARHVG